MPTTPSCSGTPEDKTAWFYFYRAQDREYIFYTDAAPFAARYDLVKQDGLEGFCSWVLGEEDPGNLAACCHRTIMLRRNPASQSKKN